MSRKEISENVKRKLYAESIYNFLTLITLLIFALYQEGYLFYCVFYEVVKIPALFLCLVILIFVIILVLVFLGN